MRELPIELPIWEAIPKPSVGALSPNANVDLGDFAFFAFNWVG